MPPVFGKEGVSGTAYVLGNASFREAFGLYG